MKIRLVERGPAVKVPTGLLLDQRLNLSSMVAGMFALMKKPGSKEWSSRRQAAAHMGMAPGTFGRSLESLKATGWILGRVDDLGTLSARAARYGESTVLFPVELLLDPDVSLKAKALYAYLLLVLARSPDNPRFTYMELRKLTGSNHRTIVALIDELLKKRWLGWNEDADGNKILELHNPFEARRQRELNELKLRLEVAKYWHEQVMREFLNAIVMCAEYSDGGRHGTIKNPETGMSLEYDRHYWGHHVAFEYNGRQHYETTERYKSEEALRSQKARDLMKVGASALGQTRVVIIHREDLTLQGMLRKMEGLGLPMYDLEERAHLINYLEGLQANRR